MKTSFSKRSYYVRLTTCLLVVGIWIFNIEIKSIFYSQPFSTKGSNYSTVPHFDPFQNISDSNCSCLAPWNETATAQERMGCCRRTVVGAHKMGWQMLISINRNYLARIPNGQVKKGWLYNVQHITIDLHRKNDYDILMNQTTNQVTVDYRTVIVTRHFYDTLVSGYLYHQSGRECYLSSGGKPASGWLQRFDWEAFILNSRGNNESSYWTPPSSKGLSLCEYLQEVPADVGMRVYINVALKMWLRPLLNLTTAYRNKSFSNQRVLFLCYEQFNEDDKFPEAIQKAGSFLYPGEDTGQWNGLQRTNGGGGGHSTTKDNSTRNMLYDAIQYNDNAYFGGEVLRGSRNFACNSAQARR